MSFKHQQLGDAQDSATMRQLVLTCSLALLAACAADDTLLKGPSAVPSTYPSAPTASGRTVQAQAREITTLGDKSRRAPADLSRSLTYFDGESERMVWISNDLVAEMAPSDKGRLRVLQFDSAAEAKPQQQTAVRLWRVRAQHGVDDAAHTMMHDGLLFSPVVHESPSSSSPRCALPGGVVATFAAGWTRAQIEAWAMTRGVGVPQPVVAEANLYLLASAPGLASIELANRLHASGELVACTPNIWREASTR